MCARSSTRVIAAPTMALPTCSPHWSHTPGRSTAPPCISILRNAPCSSPLLPEPYVELTLNRWRSIRPDLNVVSATDFFAQNRRFYLIHTSRSIDVVTRWLAKQHLVAGLV